MVQEGIQLQLPSRPTTNDREAWKDYWKAQGQPWRTEPEIDTSRQEELAKRREIVPNIEQGIYPFRDMKLNRADIEWLLATHDGGRGPLDWSDERERNRVGLDLRGADLREAKLHELPLAGLHAGLTRTEYLRTPREQRDLAVVRLEGADLSGAQLQGAALSKAQLQGVNLRNAYLQWANLARAQLQGADLRKAHLHWTNFTLARLHGADLYEVSLSDQNRVGPFVADARWDEINLATVDWSQMKILADEYWARQNKDNDGKRKEREARLRQYKVAVRANRQLAVDLRKQGLSEEGDHFAYRALLLQRTVWHLQRKPLKSLLSWFLFLIAGYGYRPGISFLWYLGVIIGFALVYHAFGNLPLFPPDAFIYSITSFHGRGIFPGLGYGASLHNPLVMLAALEAMIGLIIEVSFIATFTQRFFGK